MTIYKKHIDTARGPCLARATPDGLIALSFPGEQRYPGEAIFENSLSPAAPGFLFELEPALASYLAGKEEDFGHFPVDYGYLAGTGFSDFTLDVFRICRQIARGETAAYGELAGWMKKPRAARAVGSALGSNPLPLIIPCHRVICASGEPGGYRWGVNKKETLLVLEGGLCEAAD